MDSVAQIVKHHAHLLGFELVGIAAATEADDFAHLCAWLKNDYAGEMTYMHRHGQARRHPSSILSAVRSVVMAGMNYGFAAYPDRTGNTAKIARYAHSHDYHDVIRLKLKQLLQAIIIQQPYCRGRVVVDTAPLLERDFARRAGLGWIGKNTMLINPRLGSFFVIGALLLDIEVEADEPFRSDHCGTCTACLDACPTHAFPAPHQLDARACISYLTIELRGLIPEERKTAIDEWIFGCDICQDVCPWNHKVPLPSFRSRPDLIELDVIEMLQLTEVEFKRRFSGTALTRPKRAGLIRNAAIIAGNRRMGAALPALTRLRDDPDPGVHEAAQWAIGKINENSPRP